MISYYLKKMNSLRVGIYLRLSNEDKDKQYKNDDSESIKNQRNLLIDYINKHNNLTLVDEYCDEDISGAGTYRPQFERLIKDCQNQKIDVVLCKSQSRFSRDMEIVEKYINNKFIEWNIRFIGISDNADTEILGNKKSRQINGLVNEWYLEDVSNNIRSAFNSKMKHGEFISPFAPFGYKISTSDNNKLIIDPVAGQIVKKIFKLYLSGLGYTSIANYLNDNDIPSPSLYKYENGIKLNVVSNKPRNKIKWSNNAIKKILTNEVYIGNLVQGKRTTVSYKNHKIVTKPQNLWIKSINTHKALISEKIFNKVQKLISSRTRQLKKTGKSHCFSGIIYCNECGYHMRKKNSSLHEYIVCPNTECKSKSSIRFDILEDIILKEINTKIKKYCDYNKLENMILNKYNYSIDMGIRQLILEQKYINEKILKNKSNLKKLYEDKNSSLVSLELFQELMGEYIIEKKILSEKLNLISDKINSQLNNKNKQDVKKMLNKYVKLTQLDSPILQEFIKKIKIGKLKNNLRNINIEWNFF